LTNNVAAGGSIVVQPNGVSATSELGTVNVWAEVKPPDHNPNWNPINAAQTPGWTEIAA